jgi:DNA invertase Pin-like site-specific DNA recombinase
VTPAFAYLRTSSATNVGADKDSDKRQRAACEAFAKQAGYAIAGEYYDADVRGDEAVWERQAFAAMMGEMLADGVKTVIVETASRFARDVIVQETGLRRLRALGITLIAADHPDTFSGDSPTANLVRQILGAVSEFEKSMTVGRLKAARDRIKAKTGRCEGKKPAPDGACAMARKLHGEGVSLRAIASRLALAGYLSPSARPYLPQSVKWMLALAPEALAKGAASPEGYAGQGPEDGPP